MASDSLLRECSPETVLSSLSQRAIRTCWRLSRTSSRRKAPPRAVWRAGDVADAQHLAELALLHEYAFGSMNLLVLSAGPELPVEWAPTRKSLRQDGLGQLACALRDNSRLSADAACRGNRRSDRGGPYRRHGINHRRFAEPGLPAYGATKAGLISLVETLNAEESGAGVSATAIAPAYVDTDMSSWITDSIPVESMIPVEDIVALVRGLTMLSARSVVPKIVVNWAGATGFVAQALSCERPATKSSTPVRVSRHLDTEVARSSIRGCGSACRHIGRFSLT